MIGLFRRGLSLALLLMVPAGPASEAAGRLPGLSGPYLGQTPPGAKAEIFAAGVISTGHPENFILFSASGTELYYGVGGAPHGVILTMREHEGRWSEPVTAPFSGRYSAEAGLSPDGNRIVLSMGVPPDGTGPPQGNWQAWFVDRTSSGWSEPFNPGPPLNSDDFSLDYPTLAADGSVYFFSGSRPEGQGNGDIWKSSWNPDGYAEPQNLGAVINSEHWDIDPYISPAQDFLVFASNRPGGVGGFDLYVARRDETGGWSEPRNLGPEVNSTADEFHPFVSLDGNYLFFCSKRRLVADFSERSLSWEEKLRIMQAPGNGQEDVYWVDAAVLTERAAPGPR